MAVPGYQRLLRVVRTAGNASPARQAIIVVQTLTDSACAIAASYPAKRLGITTGTLLREARRICPDVVPVQANHRLYTDYHERILKAVDTCLPIEKSCRSTRWLPPHGEPSGRLPAARELALKVKRALASRSANA